MSRLFTAITCIFAFLLAPSLLKADQEQCFWFAGRRLEIARQSQYELAQMNRSLSYLSGYLTAVERLPDTPAPPRQLQPIIIQGYAQPPAYPVPGAMAPAYPQHIPQAQAPVYPMPRPMMPAYPQSVPQAQPPAYQMPAPMAPAYPAPNAGQPATPMPTPTPVQPAQPMPSPGPVPSQPGPEIPLPPAHGAPTVCRFASWR